jgi:hypothetical protein
MKYYLLFVKEAVEDMVSTLLLMENSCGSVAMVVFLRFLTRNLVEML